MLQEHVAKDDLVAWGWNPQIAKVMKRDALNDPARVRKELS
jgi:hypothetical protein